MGAFLFRHRVLVMIASVFIAGALIWLCAQIADPAAPSLLTAAPVRVWPDGKRVILVVTGALCVLGFALRNIAEARLGDVVWKQGETPALVDDGIFARTRNPLYLGAGVFYVGLIALWAPLVVTVIVGVAFFAMVHAVVLHEEQMLRTSLGAPYADYLTRVPRWLPFGPRKHAAISARAYVRAVLPNLGLLSFGLYRLVVAALEPGERALRLLGLANLLALLTWLVVIAVKRARGLRPS